MQFYIFFCVVSFQMSEMLNGKSENVYHLPNPVACPLNESGDPVNPRIPPIEKQPDSQVRSKHFFSGQQFTFIA